MSRVAGASSARSWIIPFPFIYIYLFIPTRVILRKTHAISCSEIFGRKILPYCVFVFGCTSRQPKGRFLSVYLSVCPYVYVTGFVLSLTRQSLLRHQFPFQAIPPHQDKRKQSLFSMIYLLMLLLLPFLCKCTSDPEKSRVLLKNKWYFDYLPTSPFTVLELQNPWIDEFYVVQERRATDFKVPKSWKGSSSRCRFLYSSIYSTRWKEAQFSLLI